MKIVFAGYLDFYLTQLVFREDLSSSCCLGLNEIPLSGDCLHG